MKNLSIIIPVYNNSDIIEETVDNLERSELTDFSVILVNDGSSDNTGEKCKGLKTKYDNIRYYEQENRGVSAARNCGIEMAEGNLIVFLDADDSIEAEKLQRLRRNMEKNDTIDLVIFGLSFDYYYRGKMYRREEVAFPEGKKMQPEEWGKKLFSLYSSNSISSSCTKIFRKSVIEENNISFNEKMFLYEDMEFVLRYLSCCKTIYNSPEIVYHYRQQEDEGNAGRRLLRIDHLPELIGHIEIALRELMFQQGFDEKVQKEGDAILICLYLLLAREKISVSDGKQIRQIGQDMSCWLQEKPEWMMEGLDDDDKKYIRWIVNGNVVRLIAGREYDAIRHRVAVKVKNTVFYKHLKDRRN